MNVLHLSDTTLSGSPIRIVNLLNKHTEHKARHIVWTTDVPGQPFRKFETDAVGMMMTRDELDGALKWADVIHYHNRYARQQLFKKLGIKPPQKPSVIQIHSPRLSEDFREEVESKIPLAIIAQYHVRQWPEASYVVPNVVDITTRDYQRDPIPLRAYPVVSYAPSNTSAKGFDDKGYGIVTPVLKRMRLEGKIYFQLIIKQPHEKVLELKRGADIGIDEIVTGSYHLSSLEYLAMGVPCFANLDDQTEKVVKDLTGSRKLPWLKANKDNFASVIKGIIKSKEWPELGEKSLRWMKKYWNPEVLCKQYTDMYEDLL